MKEYEVKVVTTVTVYVEANSKAEALEKAQREAIATSPDTIYTEILSINDLED
jgi:hypothetical protein